MASLHRGGVVIHEEITFQPLPTMLVENSSRRGREPAFTDDRREVSWAELARRTAGLAAGLHVDRGTRIAFCLDNSVELIEGLLATVRAAAVGVPLSPRGTDAELAALLADCDPAVLVTDRRNLPRFARLANGVRLVVTGGGPVPDGVVRFDDLIVEGPTPANAEPSFGFSSVYHRVLREQGPFEAMALRYFASYAVPSFTVADRAPHAVEPVLLAGGDGTPVVFIPDYLKPYNRVPTGLAKQFGGERDLYLLEQPGFGAVRAEPDSMATLVRTHADTVRALALGRPIVLAGFCAGGVIEHAVARCLAETGLPPAGVVLLDTHIGVLRRDDPRALALVAASAGLPSDIADGVDDSLLLAGSGYARVLEGWRPESSPVPTLLVRAEPTAEMLQADSGRDWRPSWPLPHDTADVAVDHHSLVHHDADTTAGAIRSWSGAGEIT